MKRTYCLDHHWRRVMKALAVVVAVAVVALLVLADWDAQGAQGLSPASQEHQAIQNQLTTYEGNQTSQHSGLPQAWDKTLPANDPGGACPSTSSRFTCVMGNAAVRDNETGLVWERSPETTLNTWSVARFTCAKKAVGGRKG